MSALPVLSDSCGVGSPSQKGRNTPESVHFTNGCWRNSVLTVYLRGKTPNHQILDKAAETRPMTTDSSCCLRISGTGGRKTIHSRPFAINVKLIDAFRTSITNALISICQ